MVDTALKMGVAPRAEVDSPEAALPYWERGVRHFCVGTDTRILYNWYKENGALMQNLFAERGGGVNEERDVQNRRITGEMNVLGALEAPRTCQLESNRLISQFLLK
ncbi:MAG: hypothetical protein HC802_22245 [Caldilineaceae bacterium]|nr:hypothetical protein [Caldilineaceae bacterium]